MHARIALVAALLLCAACPAGQRFVKSVAADCTVTLGSAANDTIARALESARGDANAPTWEAFAQNELVSRGVSFAVCVVEQALDLLDRQLPPIEADPSGDLKAPQVATVKDVHLPNGAVTSPALLKAHGRMVDWLRAHHRNHAHRTRL